MSQARIPTKLEELKTEAKKKYQAFSQTLPNTDETSYKNLSSGEKDLLSISRSTYFFDSYRSASHSEKIEEEAFQILLNILNGKNLEQQKALLAALKIRDRKNMSFPAVVKVNIAAAGSLGIIGLVGVGLILGLALSLWPLAIVIGLLSLWFIAAAIFVLKTRTSKFDRDANNSWGLIPSIETFLNTLTTEHIALLTKLNSSDYQPNAKSSSSSTSTNTKNEPTIVTPGQVDHLSTQSDPLFVQPSSSSQTQTSRQDSHPNNDPVSDLPQNKGS